MNKNDIWKIPAFILSAIWIFGLIVYVSGYSLGEFLLILFGVK